MNIKAGLGKYGVLAAICLFFMAGIALADPPTPAASPCDPQYYESLKSRAWLEAQREITQNQNLIFKPDSVLQYTCFDKSLDVLAQNAPNMFSQTNRWGGAPTDMTNALQNLVGTAVQNYVAANFGYPLLGGRATGLNYTPGGVTSGGYSCTVMNDVWKKAKCMDFASDNAQDGFFTFDQSSTDADHRFLPTSCGGALPLWATQIKNAYATQTPPWTPDKTVTYFDALDPANCSDTTKVQAISTGILVQRPQETPTMYLEKVCIPAGCHYVPTGGATGNCSP